MWEQVNETFRRAALRMSDNVGNFLPGLVVLLIILLATLILAIVVRVLLVRVLQRFEFDRHAEHLGLTSLVEGGPRGGWSAVVARTVMWIILALGLLAGITALDAAMPTQFAVTMFGYVPDVIAAIVILLAGTVAARFVARSVLIGAVNLQMHSARLLSTGVKWLMLILAWAMALEHLGIGGQVLRLAFAILFGGIVLALALAVGLGSKDMVSRSLERQLGDSRKGPDKLPHV